MLAPTNPKVHRNQHTQTNPAVEPRSRWSKKRKAALCGLSSATLLVLSSSSIAASRFREIRVSRVQ